MKNPIIIATRSSQLAIWQANFVKNQLQNLYPNLQFIIKSFNTKGDQVLNMPLAQFSKDEGKGLFIKELELALLSGEADCAVHSLKDFPAQTDHRFTLAAVLARAKANDSFLSEQYPSFDTMPANAIVGTTSLRRKMQILAQYPKLKVQNLRGNVNTRVLKLKQGLYDAIVLASAAVHRLKLNSVKYTHILDEKDFIPAMGQGALCIETLSQNQDLKTLIKPLNDDLTYACTNIERVFVKGLEGGCQVPIGVHVSKANNEFLARAIVGLPNGTKLIHKTMKHKNSEYIAKYFHQEFIKAGAQAILKEALKNPFV